MAGQEHPATAVIVPRRVENLRQVRSMSITHEYFTWFEKLDMILETEGLDFSTWVREQAVHYVTEKLGAF